MTYLAIPPVGTTGYCWLQGRGEYLILSRINWRDLHELLRWELFAGRFLIGCKKGEVVRPFGRQAGTLTYGETGTPFKLKKIELIAIRIDGY